MNTYEIRLSPKEEQHHSSGPDRSLLEHSKWDESIITSLILDPSEATTNAKCSNKASDHIRRVPGLGLSTPLQCEQEAAGGCGEQEAPQWVHLLELFFQCKITVAALLASQPKKDSQTKQD